MKHFVARLKDDCEKNRRHATLVSRLTLLKLFVNYRTCYGVKKRDLFCNFYVTNFDFVSPTCRYVFVSGS